MELENALRKLGATATYSEGMHSRLADDPRNLAMAKRVSGVFTECERRLLALNIPSDMRGLTNAEGDFVCQIAKCAQAAFTVVFEGNNDPALALDRAYSNGAKAEKLLNQLIESLNAASVTRFGNVKSRADLVQQLLEPTQRAEAQTRET